MATIITLTHLYFLITISLTFVITSCESKKYGDIVQNYLKKQEQEQHISGDEEGNPFPYIQQSLFPNVGPYIKFANFDRSHPFRIPEEIRVSLVWRRSREFFSGGFLAHYIVNKTGIPSMNGTRDKENIWFGYWHETFVCRVPFPIKLFTRNYQKYNLFGATEELAQKDLQILNMRRLIKKYGKEDFRFHFDSYILPKEFDDFKEAWSMHENKLWIIKPHTGALSKGVTVIDHWSEVPANTRLTTVQKYLDSPYLIRGRKFELRLYVLATSFNPLRIYLYGDGCTKISYKNFTADPKFKSDPCIHIRVKDPGTECPEKIVDDFHNGVYYTANTQIIQMLKEEGGMNVEKLQEDLDDAIIKTLLSVDHKVDSATRNIHFNRYNAFQIWAFDFLIDTNSQVRLIEVNSIPGLNILTEEDVRLELPMMQEILNLVGYQFPPILSEEAKLILKKSIENSTGDPTFNEKLYTFELSEIDKLKQSKYSDWKYNSSMTDSEMSCGSGILEDLSPDDIKQLIVAEDELNRTKFFRRIFPSQGMRKYLKYVESNPYYYLLMHAWEHRYGSNRSEGIARLGEYTKSGVHLN